LRAFEIKRSGAAIPACVCTIGRAADNTAVYAICNLLQGPRPLFPAITLDPCVDRTWPFL